MRILSIETSCDETSIAIAEFNGPKRRPRVTILSHIVSSQVKLHAKYGGVVPNLARREHEKNLVPILLQALHESNVIKSKNGKLPTTNYPSTGSGPRAESRDKPQTILEREPELQKQFKEKIISLPIPAIDAIAVTYGPGLAPALWVGVNFARALAILWDKPLIPVNHMEGHLFSSVLEQTGKIPNSKFQIQEVTLPMIALLVSGGHTELVLMKKFGTYELIGETLDDAAGEAFDKVARILGLGYPGGPVLAAEAAKRQAIHLRQARPSGRRGYGGHASNKRHVKLPRPMMNSKDFSFSFSGLKTAVLYLTRDLGKSKTKRLTSMIAREFQDAVVDVLVSKTIRAAKQFGAKTVAIGGGVSANAELQTRMGQALEKELPGVPLLVPMPSLTGDNALMIALAAYATGKKKTPDKVGAEANLKLAGF